MLKYRLRMISKKKLIFWSTFVLLFCISMGSIVRYYAIASFDGEKGSSISGDTVYVNDLQADWDYYQSLNWTEITSKSTLPGANVNINDLKYDQDSMVAVQINYNGLDINGKSNSKKSGWYGWISSKSNEHQSKLVYYKYYPIKDGNIKIELIDNPYTARPKIGTEQYKGFNGWVCDDEATSGISCSDMVFSYDDDYYLRYVTIPSGKVTVDDDGNKKMVVNLRASWIDAASGWTYNDTEMGRFKKGMVQLDTVNIYDKKWKFTGNYIFRTGQKYYEKKSVELGETFYGISKNFVDYTTEGRVCEAGSGDTDTKTVTQTVNDVTQEVTVEYCNYYVLTTDTTGNTSKQYWYWNGNVLSEVNFSTGAGLIKETNGTTNANAKAVLATYQARSRNSATSWSTATYVQYENGESLAGLYYQMAYPGSNPHLYYKSNGVSCAVSTCNKGATVYKLIQTNDTTKYNGYSIATMNIVTKNYATVDDNGTYAQTKTVYNDVSKYYYLATRDTNIMHFGSGYGKSSAVNDYNSDYDDIKYTLSAAPGRGELINAGLTIESVGLRVYNDMVIENLWSGTTTMSTGNNYMESDWYNYHIYAECNNLKIGRYAGIKKDSTSYANSTSFFARGVYGGMVKSTPSDRRARIIVESGYYYHAQTFGNRDVSNSTNLQMVYGSDYDRVRQTNGDNAKLRFYRTVCTAYSGGTHDDNKNTTTPASLIITKSGTFGAGVINNFDPSDDYAYGLYAASYMNATGDSLRMLKIEGGNIACVNGGPGTKDQQEIMSATYMTGGTAINVVGGAGTDTGEGHRLVSITGGTVKNAVAGGSNSSVGSGYGNIKGDSMVYIGGTAVIGDPSFTAIFRVSERGSVFAGGLGRPNMSSAGCTYNTRLIINGGTINGSAYGGANYGYVSRSGASKTDVFMYAGTVEKSLYGGSNLNYFGNSSYTNTLNVAVAGGTVKGSVYAGANSDGNINGNANLTITGGTINGSAYGGSNSAGRITGNVTVKVSGGTMGNLFGGSNAGQRINGNISINMSGGTVNKSVYGCSNNTTEDSRSCTQGTMTFNMSGGTVKNAIYGGSNTSGYVTGAATLKLTGGTVGVGCTDTNKLTTCGSVFGGGYGTNTRMRSSVTVTTETANDAGLVVNNIYGGSGLGRVNYTSGNTVVTINGGTIKEAVYGGGMGNTSTKPYTLGNITVNVKDGIINNVYGGSNVNGDLPDSGNTMNVNVTGGIINKIYGGSKGSAATVGTSNVSVSGGKILERVYGGGNESKTTTTNVTVTGGNFYDIGDEGFIAEIFGGGAEAAATTTNVNINAGSDVYNVYGGSETSGNVTTSNVNMNAGQIECNVYGGGFKASTATSNVNLNGTNTRQVIGGDSDSIYSYTCGHAFGGGAQANITTQANVNLKGSKFITVYGGSNTSGTVKKSVINATKGNVHTIFGGNNQGGYTTDSVIYVNGTLSIRNVFGGSNGKDASISNSTQVHLNNVNISDSVYGGGNQAPVLGSTLVYLYSGNVGTVYGGGNQAHVGQVTLNGSDYATGIKTGSTSVNIISGEIEQSVFGSGNSSFVYGTTEVNVGAPALAKANGDSDTKFTPAAGNIVINKNVFGGSNTNTDGETVWDPNTASAGVIGDVNVSVDGSNGYTSSNITNIIIDGSIYGSGNNSTVNGISRIYVDNFGTSKQAAVVNSIQRATNVYLTDSVIELTGERDRAFATQYKYGLIRIDYFYMLGSGAGKGTTLYMANGATYLKNYNSGYFNNNGDFVAQTVTNNGGVSVNTASTNNKLYMYANVLLAVSDSEKPSYESGSTNAGPVTGMTYLGMYRYNDDDSYNLGYYDTSITSGTGITEELQDTFSDAYTFVYGKHSQEPATQIKTNGFYTNYVDEETNAMYVDYVGVTPLNADYYKWVIGDEPAVINVDIEATKQSVEGAVNQTISLEELREVVNGQSQEWRDAKMTIKSVDTSKFYTDEPDVYDGYDTFLVDKSEIKTINTDDTNDDGIVDANNFFALTMGTTSTGWLDNYKTNFYDTDEGAGFGTDFCSVVSAGDCIGNDIYIYDSTTTQRSLTFWLYHSKNLDLSVSTASELEDKIVPMGQVIINTEFFNPNGEADSTTNIRTVQIIVNIAMRESTSDSYGKAIAPGKKYEKFQPRNTSIVSDGSFSIFQSISLDLTKSIIGDPDGATWSVDKLYGTAKTVEEEDGSITTYSEAYRYLASSYALPVGTKITMLDLITGEQYYYNVSDSNSYNAKAKEIEDNGVARYMLEDFIRMGSTTESNKYNDDMNGTSSVKYYTHSGTSQVATEEFIFTVDFANVAPADQVKTTTTNFFYLVLSRDVNGREKTILEPTGEPINEMVYTLNPEVESKISTEGGYVVEGSDTLAPETTIYVGESTELELNTSLIQEKNGVVVNNVSDTEFDDYKLGAKITIWRPKTDDDGNTITDSNGEVVYEQITNDLFGTIITINGVDYYPQTDGSTRLQLAGRVTDVTSSINIDFSNSGLTYDEYKLVVETFASYDGLYYGNYNPTYNEFPFELLNNQYGLIVEIPPVQVTHDVNTGKDKEGSREIIYTVNTKNGLANPNLKISLQRRTYGGVYDTTYTNVDLANIAEALYKDDSNTNLINTNNCFSSYDPDNNASTNNSVCLMYNLGDIAKNLDGDTYTFTMTLRDGPTDSEINDKNNSKWKSGTYRVVYSMYDGNSLVGEVYEYLIIRSLDIDEEVIEGSGS